MVSSKKRSDRYLRLSELRNKIICADTLQTLKKFPARSIDICVTSPPYFQTRNYHFDGQIGQEETVKTYVYNLVQIFEQVYRVLKTRGSLWVNIGDKSINKFTLNVPEEFVIAMVLDGWHKAQTIIWEKPNAMPGGGTTKSKFNINFEPVYHFVKSQDYYFNQLYEPYSDITLREAMKDYTGKGLKAYEAEGVQNPSDVKRRIIERVRKIKFGGNRAALYGHPKYSGNGWNPSEKGAIKRAVWRISHNSSKHIHLATFPVKLVQNCIESTCPEKGLVLDCFMGSGSTALAAYFTKRDYVGIDLSQEYCDLAEYRVDTEIARNLLSPSLSR